MEEDVKLEQKVVKGVAWSFFEKFLTMVMQMVVSIIVARRLMPEDFGVMAILTFFTSVALTIVDSGFSQTLIRKSSPTDEEYRSVLTFNMLVALVLYVVLLLLAHPLAQFYGHTEIVSVAPVLFLLLPINAMCVVQTVMYTCEFRFALLSKIVFVASLISGGVAVVMAICGCGIWSLVAQRLLQMGIKAVAFWWLRRWRTDARFSLAALKAMAPYSMRLLITDLIASIYNNVAQLFIGKIYTTSVLGYYSQAQKLKDLPVISTVQAVQGVTFPALSKLSDDDDKFGAGYLRIMTLTSYLLFPVILGLIAIAPEMFAILLGVKWMPTVPYFEILALTGMFHPLSVVAYNILKVRSDGRVILRLEVVKRIIMTAILAVTIPYSVKAVAWGVAVMSFVDFVINIVAARQYTTVSLYSLIRGVMPQLLLSLLMFYALYVWTPFFGFMSLGATLAVKILMGVAIYVAGSYMFRLRTFKEGVEIVRSIIKRDCPITF